jgi:Ni,Fe-hydrogenase maturation factor
MKIYVFGNELVGEDNLPLQLLPQLKKKLPIVKFVIADPNEDFPPEGERDLVILDTVKGIKKPSILHLEDFEKAGKTPVSPHDYDLLMHLLLLKKLKRIKKVTIIGLPLLHDRTKVVMIQDLIAEALIKNFRPT